MNRFKREGYRCAYQALCDRMADISEDAVSIERDPELTEGEKLQRIKVSEAYLEGMRQVVDDMLETIRSNDSEFAAILELN